MSAAAAAEAAVHQPPAVEEEDDLPVAPPGGIMNAIPMDFNSEQIRKLFLADALVAEHVAAVLADPRLYVKQLHTMVERKLATSWSVPIKGRVLAALVVAKQLHAVDYLLRLPGLYSIAEVLKAVQLLDMPRRRRQLQAKLARLEAALKVDPKAVKTQTLAKLRTDINNIQQEPLDNGSVSGALAKRLRKWVRRIPDYTLEFFLLTYPPDSWKALADVLHLRVGDFSLPYFLPVIFGAKPPADSVMAVASSVTRDNIMGILEQYPRLANCYSYLRKCLQEQKGAGRQERDTKMQQVCDMGFTKHQARVALDHVRATSTVQEVVDWILENDARIVAAPVRQEETILPLPAMTWLAERAPLEEVVWWYEELACPAVEAIVHRRFEQGEQIGAGLSHANYGKLMERLLSFRESRVSFAPMLLPQAEKKLCEIDVPKMDGLRVAVLGDASGSMEIAIKTATTLGSLLSVALHADLCFFNDKAFPPPCLPRSAAQVVEVVERVKASGSTSMAAALWPYLKQRKPIDLFVLVSDEGENVKCEGMFFAQMLQRYRDEVSPNVKVFLVSFLRVGDEGTIMQRMKETGVTPRQFRLDPVRPDTSKFDALLGLVTLEMSELRKRMEAVEEVLDRSDMARTTVQLVLEY